MNPDLDTEALWEDLFVVLEEGKVVPIVGRDLLDITVDGRTVRLYTHLAELLAAKLEVDTTDLPRDDLLDAVACRYIERGGRSSRVYTTLKSIMPAPDELDLPESLVKLAAIEPLRLFVSTTFDPLLEAALDRARHGGQGRTKTLSYDPRDVEDLPHDWRESGDTIVFHLLGRLSATPDYAVTAADVLEFMHALQSETRSPGVLFDELRQQQLLLIGCSFPDWLTRFLVRVAQGEAAVSRERSDLVADDTVRADTRLVYFLTKFAGCQVFPGGPAEFVAQLHERWKRRHPEVPAGAGPPAVVEPNGSGLADMVDGSIFLSYASEDRPVVEAIKVELERQGMDVWFDRDDLRGGDTYETLIRRNIRRSSLFIAIISSHSLVQQPRFFRKEWRAALDRAEMFPDNWPFIVPVVIDATEPYRAEGLPEPFTALQWMRLPDGRCTDEFLTRVRDSFRNAQRLASR
jgi:TIR domain/SIR2-like domain